MIRNITNRRLSLALLKLACIALLCPATLNALDAERADVKSFMDKLVKEHGFEREYVESILTQGKTQQSILDAISRPAERTKAWYEYRAIFVTPKRIDAGVTFWKEHRARLEKISAESGVPAQVIAAIIGVETFYGTRTGSYRVIDSLTTLGFDYPPRSKFFRSELEQLFLLARDEQLKLDEIKGSYAGALGPPQFIPSSYRHYAVDGDGDGRRDLFNNWDDVLASVANYFVAHDWRRDEPTAARGFLDEEANILIKKNGLKLTSTVAELTTSGIHFDTELDKTADAELISLEGEGEQEYWVGFHNFYVITRYNRSVMYALSVHQLSEALAERIEAESRVADHQDP
jgi:membrane-bound lytic murein transglycosylase B